MADQLRKLPRAVIQSGEEKRLWLLDIQTLSIATLIELYAYAEAIVETVREPLVILDKNLKVKSVNKAFLDTFRTTKDDNAHLDRAHSRAFSRISGRPVEFRFRRSS